MSENLEPARLVRPGRIIERELEARGWTQRDLAAIMERPPQVISEIVRGSKQITPETAIELGKAFETSAEVWTALEYQYRLDLARRQCSDDDDQITRRARLFSLAPIAELIKRKWIKATGNINDLEREVCHFLDIKTVGEALLLPNPLRVSSSRGPEYASVVSWVQRVKHVSRQRPSTPYDRNRLCRAIPDLRVLAQTPEQVANVPLLLRDLGVHLVVVRHLPRTYVDGVACIVDGQPVIGLSLRYDRIDWFWFTLMHELAHLALDHEHPPVDSMDNKEALSIGIEAEADQQARQWLVEHQAFKLFVKRNAPYFSKAKVEQFAASQHLHPGIIVGQLQYEGLIPYANLRALLVKVSSFLRDWMDPTYDERAERR